MRRFRRGAQPSIDFRPAQPSDLGSCAEVLYEADDALSASRNLPVSPRNPEAVVRLFEHMHEHNAERWWLAEHDGRIVGFSGSAAYDDMVYLGFLFVLPEFQAGGLGRQLLEMSMRDSDNRAVCIASYQPISAALYARYGMVPRVPIYMLSGAPREPLPALPPGLHVRKIETAAVAPLDTEVCGFARPDDHDWWEAMGRVRYGLFDGSDLVGYGYVQAIGRLGPFVVRDASHLLPFVGRLIEEAPAVETWLINVPGPASETFATLLRSGMRLEGAPAIFCATEQRIDHARYLPVSFALP